MERRFIESVRFPFREVSEASAVEKGPGRPPHWEMVFWWTRKPLISARAVIAGCLLPEDTNPANFLRSIGIVVKKRRADGRPVFEKSPHRVKPMLRFDGIRLLDPFACFGSIPLEGLRLGLKVTACDLLPVGYIFLKAVLEYPVKYGRQLVEDVKKWGEWVAQRLKEDPLIRELYEDDVAVYIGSWEIKCPHCGRWTPLVGNWWLARVKDREGYKRLAWMEPRIVGNKVEIRIRDLNKELGDKAIRKAKVEGLKVTVNGKEFRVPESNIEARRELATCLHCNQSIMQIDPETGKHYTNTKNLPEPIKNRLEGYVKFALKLYNKAYGLEESIPIPARIGEIPVRLRLLVKVKVQDGNLIFESCSEEDQEKLENARQEIKKLLQTNDPDVPRERISPYSVRYLFPILYGINEWYKLFNPRQLFTLIKLTKLIRDAGKRIEKEKLEEFDEGNAFTFAEAVTVYLAIALISMADFNSITSRWAPHAWTKVNRAFTHRGIAMIWNWCDVSPLHKYIGTWNNCLQNVVDGIEYLVSAFCNTFGSYDGKKNLNRNLKVLLDDATTLIKLGFEEKVDVIITDPPYYDDVPYTELSDFYYVWLKRVLSDVYDNRLIPRFLPEAFFEKINDDWVEVLTQWEKYSLNEVSLNPARLGLNAKLKDGIMHFQNLLNSAFITMTSKLQNDGLLVTYYAHTDPDAWKALLEAGWAAAGLQVSNAFPLTTESAQSVVKQGKLSMDTSIIVVWRKGGQGSIEASQLYEEMVNAATGRARELMNMGAVGRDLVIGTLAASLATATKYREVRVMGKINTKTLVDKYIYPATYLGLARALAKKADLRNNIKSPDAMFYLLVKSILAGAKKKVLESTDLRLFSIGTSLDLNTAIKLRILKAKEKEPGAKVAKAKTLTLVEPTSAERSKIAELLEARGINPANPKLRCTIDALHLIEYFAITYSREQFRHKLEELRVNYPAYVEEALALARIMARILPSNDPEKGLSARVVEYLAPAPGRLTSFIEEEGENGDREPG